MSAEPKWMPVFVVIEAVRSQPQFAAHPSHKGPLRIGPDDKAEDFVQRVGTAFRHDDGAYTIQLTALPVNGQLLMRPPSPGEHIDPTFKKEG